MLGLAARTFPPTLNHGAQLTGKGIAEIETSDPSTLPLDAPGADPKVRTSLGLEDKGIKHGNAVNSVFEPRVRSGIS